MCVCGALARAGTVKSSEKGGEEMSGSDNQHMYKNVISAYTVDFVVVLLFNVVHDKQLRSVNLATLFLVSG